MLDGKSISSSATFASGATAALETARGAESLTERLRPIWSSVHQMNLRGLLSRPVPFGGDSVVVCSANEIGDTIIYAEGKFLAKAVKEPLVTEALKEFGKITVGLAVDRQRKHAEFHFRSEGQEYRAELAYAPEESTQRYQGRLTQIAIFRGMQPLASVGAGANGESRDIAAPSPKGGGMQHRILKLASSTSTSSVRQAAKQVGVKDLHKMASQVTAKEAQLQELKRGAKQKTTQTSAGSESKKMLENRRESLALRNAKLKLQLEQSNKYVEKLERRIHACQAAMERLTVKQEKEREAAELLLAAQKDEQRVELAARKAGAPHQEIDIETQKAVSQIDERIATLKSRIKELESNQQAISKKAKHLQEKLKSIPGQKLEIVRQAKAEAVREETEFLADPHGKVVAWGADFGLPVSVAGSTERLDPENLYDNWGSLIELSKNAFEERAEISEEARQIIVEKKIASPYLRIFLGLAAHIEPNYQQGVVRYLKNTKEAVLESVSIDARHENGIRKHTREMFDAVGREVNVDHVRATDDPIPPRTKFLRGKAEDYTASEREELDEPLRVLEFFVWDDDHVKRLCDEVVQETKIAVAHVNAARNGAQMQGLEAERLSLAKQLNEAIPDERDAIRESLRQARKELDDCHRQKKLLVDGGSTSSEIAPVQLASAEPVFRQMLEDATGRRINMDFAARMTVLKAQVQGMMRESRDEQQQYWSLVDGYEAACTELDELDAEVAVESKRLGERKAALPALRAGLRQQTEIKANELRQQLDTAMQRFTESGSAQREMITQFIAPEALDRAVTRHLKPTPSELLDRLKQGRDVYRSSAYDSLGMLLRSVADIHDSATLRFPKVMTARSKEEFEMANGSLETDGRICVHQQRVGRGFNDKNAGKMAKSFQSCYSMVWSEQKQRVVIGHLYPLIRPRQ